MKCKYCGTYLCFEDWWLSGGMCYPCKKENELRRTLREIKDSGKYWEGRE